MFKARKSRLEMPMLCIVLTIGAPALAFAYSSAAAAGGRGGDDADAGGERDVQRAGAAEQRGVWERDDAALAVLRVGDAELGTAALRAAAADVRDHDGGGVGADAAGDGGATQPSEGLPAGGRARGAGNGSEGESARRRFSAGGGAGAGSLDTCRAGRGALPAAARANGAPSAGAAGNARETPWSGGAMGALRCSTELNARSRGGGRNGMVKR